MLVACGSDAAKEVANDVPEAPQVDPLASPLERQLGFSSEPAQRRFDLTELQRQADAAMVECMQGAGFFYAVGLAGDRIQSGVFVGSGSRAWAETEGLGITRSLINALAADASEDMVGDADAANLEYVASLTAEQAAAYDSALVGEVVPDLSGQFEPAGCWGSSYSRVVRILSLVEEFDDELTTLNSRLLSDPRFQTYQQQWSACMAAAGYLYGDEQAMADDVYSRLLDIELIEVGNATQASSQSALDALLQFERGVAIASFDCRQSFADDIRQLRADYEVEFLDDNRFRLADVLEPS